MKSDLTPRFGTLWQPGRFWRCCVALTDGAIWTLNAFRRLLGPFLCKWRALDGFDQGLIVAITVVLLFIVGPLVFHTISIYISKL